MSLIPYNGGGGGGGGGGDKFEPPTCPGPGLKYHWTKRKRVEIWPMNCKISTFPYVSCDDKYTILSSDNYMHEVLVGFSVMKDVLY